MEAIYLFSKRKLHFNQIEMFLNKVNINLLGLWDNDLLDVQYGKRLSDDEYSETVTTPNGLTYIFEYQNREITVSMFLNSTDNFEVIIYMNSLDLEQRESLNNDLKIFFPLSKNIFTLFVYDKDGVNSDNDISKIYETFQKSLPKTIKTFIYKK